MNVAVTFVNAFLNYLTFIKKKKKHPEKICYFPETILCAKTCNLLATQSGFLSFVTIVLWSWMSCLIQHSLSGPNFLSFCRGWGMPFSKKQLFLLFSPRYPSDSFQWFRLFTGLLLSCYHPQSTSEVHLMHCSCGVVPFECSVISIIVPLLLMLLQGSAKAEFLKHATGKDNINFAKKRFIY